MNLRPLMLSCIVLILAAGCASATQPALRVGDAELSRSELIDKLESFGSPVGPTIVRAGGFNQAITSVVNEMLLQAIDDSLESRGVTATDADRATVVAQYQLPEDFDLSILTEEERSVFEQDARISALARVLAEEGSTFGDFINETIQEIELDPRFGSWNGQNGMSSPAPPEIES